MISSVKFKLIGESVSRSRKILKMMPAVFATFVLLAVSVIGVFAKNNSIQAATLGVSVLTGIRILIQE